MSSTPEERRGEPSEQGASGEPIAPAAIEHPQSESKYLQDVFGALQKRIKQVRCGLVCGDLETVTDLLNSVDLLVEQGAARLRSPMLNATESATVRVPDAIRFRAGQVWAARNGRVTFRVTKLDAHAVQIQWWLEGHFKNESRFPMRDLLIYVTENHMQPVRAR